MNRTIAPDLKPINHIDILTPKRIDLGHGIDLLWLDDIPDDTIKLDLIWNAGSKYQTKPLISQCTNQLLFSGNQQVISNEIAESIDVLGGYLSHAHGKDYGGFTVFGLKDSITDIFDIVASSFNMGYFPHNELEKWITIKKKEFELNLEKVNFQARRLFTEKLFGNDHPYGKLSHINDFDEINQEDLRSFYKQNYLASKPTFFLVGNAPERLIDNLKKFAAEFQSAGRVFKNSELPKSSTEKEHVSKKGALQSAIRVGRLCIDKSHPDYIPFQVLNTVLGGYFGSRLMKNIREDKGYTYGIGSGITVYQDSAYFFISTEVGVEKREDTLREIYFEMSKLQTELVPEDELTIVKNYMLGSFLRNSDGAIAMMEKYKNIYLQNLEESYYSNYLKIINNIRPDDLKAMAVKYFDSNELIEISFG